VKQKRQGKMKFVWHHGSDTPKHSCADHGIVFFVLKNTHTKKRHSHHSQH
jgi:hypothetical protein